ncbi:RagB/SusD family nutrient uptake outer membrane protein [Croceivirga radicis]|uniref:RagB/SusD family nutrient uptake outer membrane protein n=1 Tax=Croceivirga radicis TaxID=1929488 RepID=A0A1V6LSV8_9FLAO|nr:RagB/SusD family nutrient uptake outer membrane protein [Croceivirga radicis]OQD43066.1 RagB/SusD family nutrient uptake outer membrane protein [Croceivirga radicis]
MKKYIYIFLTISLLFSCDKDFLEEKPEDFLSSANAFTTYEDFLASVNNLYFLYRRQYFSRDENRPFDFIYGTDIVFDGQRSTQRHSNMVAAYDPVAEIPRVHWNLLFKTISEANAVIDQVEQSNLTDDQKTDILSQARFFRGISYRSLAYLYGGVPLVLEQLTAPKTDFTRNTKEEVLNQVIEDLNYAKDNLPSIEEAADGRVNSLAAYHLLAEVYLAVNRPQDAVAAATVVINNPATALMTTRFGSRANEEPGDVYWDLFRKNNQNRSSGNTEGIWVIQFETDVLGGGTTSTGRGGSYMLERHHGTFMRDLRVDGDRPFSWPIGDYTAGRGIGWAISTRHFSNTIWETDFDSDIRNAGHNFVREFTSTNPNSPLFGQVISTENPPEGVEVPSRTFYAYQSKCTTPFNHPDGLYANPETYQLTNAAGATYTDQYMFRLAETYLLRAEAYLMAGNLTDAASDINTVRARSNATPVAASNVDMDYILDERMRELGIEEKRRLTLMRTGLLYDRVLRFNPYYADEIQEHYNLWPIPANEIERNKDGNLEQNPGY